MAVKTIPEEKDTVCSNCKIGLTYNTEDEKLSRTKTYLQIICPRCNYEVLTTKLNNYAMYD